MIARVVRAGETDLGPSLGPVVQVTIDEILGLTFRLVPNFDFVL